MHHDYDLHKYRVIADRAAAVGVTGRRVIHKDSPGPKQQVRSNTIRRPTCTHNTP